MSWKPVILNQKKESIVKTRREDIIDLEEIKKKDNVVVIGGDRFICPECSEGWTFARMNTIVCCGITYVKN